MIDFQKKEDYIHRRMVHQTSSSAIFTLSNTEISMLDSVYDPFATPTDEQSFLNVEKTEKLDANFTAIFSLDGKNLIQQRVRYGIWQALSDIGGFYDGLGLIIGYLVSHIAATKFLLELFTGIQVNEQSPNT